MTRAQWNQSQAKLPREDRISYEQYLSYQPKPTPAPAAATQGRAANDYLGLGPLGGTGTGIAVDPVTASTTGSTGPTGPTGPASPRVYRATDGTEFTDQAAYATYQASLDNTASNRLIAQQEAALAAQASQAQRQSAYDLLLEQFKQYGLSDLVEPLKNLITSGASPSEFTIRLRESEPYKKRFAANPQRIAKGLKALDEASYLAMEDQYQEVMRQYGLPESYYAKDATGKQVGFEQLLANDVSNIELGDRLMVAQDRVLKSNPEVIAALKQFYPDINNGDILAYTLDPKNAIKDIQRKVTAAEIGGAAIQSGLKTNLARAEELQRYGVDKEAATAGFATIGAGLQRGSQLASIYQQDPYTQTTAEQEVFNVPGAQEARKQRQKITGLEKATFGGQTGITSGALARDRAGGY
jgi:hypothetical protein